MTSNPKNAGPDWQAISNTVDAMVTTLNVPKMALVNAGWGERNAERAVAAALELAARGGSTEDEEEA